MASLFPADDPKNAAARFFLPANSHPCSLLQARESAPIRARKPFPGTFFWLAGAGGPCHQARVCWAALGAWRWRGRQQKPPARGCQHCCAAQMCPPWHVVLMAARWLKLCCVFSRGSLPFRHWRCPCCPPTAGLGVGGTEPCAPQKRFLRQGPVDCCWNFSRWNSPG